MNNTHDGLKNQKFHNDNKSDTIYDLSKLISMANSLKVVSNYRSSCDKILLFVIILTKVSTDKISVLMPLLSYKRSFIEF